MRVSIIIPVYNEEKTVRQLLKKIAGLELPNAEKEIIVIDDGSSDATEYIISQFTVQSPQFTVLKHKKNQGKGAAVKTGIKHASGDYIIIQDADLEYNPSDISKLLQPIQKGEAKVVYGTRLKRLPNFSRDERTPRFFLHYLGNRSLSLLTSLLYGQWITDMETCYKIFPKEAINQIQLHARGFEFEPEITAKLLKQKYKIVEIGISTTPRGYEEGKKLQTVSDGLKSLWTLIKYRFVD